jgi:hypothetical protein
LVIVDPSQLEEIRWVEVVLEELAPGPSVLVFGAIGADPGA